MVSTGEVFAHDGLPSEEFLNDNCTNSLLVFDDLPCHTEYFNLSKLYRYFTHHKNASIIFTQHDIYDRIFKNARKEAHVFIFTGE